MLETVYPSIGRVARCRKCRDAVRRIVTRAGGHGEQSGEAVIFADLTNAHGAAFPSTVGSEMLVTELVLALTEVALRGDKRKITNESEVSKSSKCDRKSSEAAAESVTWHENGPFHGTGWGSPLRGDGCVKACLWRNGRPRKEPQPQAGNERHIFKERKRHSVACVAWAAG